jgi:hypothetical protein
VFSNRIGTDEEKKSELEQQSGNINSLQKSLKKTSSYLKLINYKKGKRKNNLIQGPAKCKRFYSAAEEAG